jgi:hypothetical protein
LPSRVFRLPIINKVKAIKLKHKKKPKKKKKKKTKKKEKKECNLKINK